MFYLFFADSQVPKWGAYSNSLINQINTTPFRIILVHWGIQVTYGRLLSVTCSQEMTMQS